VRKGSHGREGGRSKVPAPNRAFARPVRPRYSNPVNPTHAGAVAIRGEREFLLVRSSRGDEWVLPKGHIEHGESAEAAALRELREEAGVVGRIVRDLGVRDFGSSRRVAFFVVEATGTTAASEERHPRWCTLDEALASTRFEETRELLREVSS
jgi:ADP-ribose pyrophosphatase YjhB (NUDIX family)